jgi:uncharacterized protein YndB with AHSA1/START domain
MPLDPNLQVNASIQIAAAAGNVWDALTNPESIKQYFFGAETITDWKVGSEIIFQGDFNGQPWQDKGRVLEVRQNALLRYSYWSGFCGLADLPENYGTVTYSLAATDQGTVLTVAQHGYANEESQQNSAKGWNGVLGQIKSIAEKSA